MEDPLRNSERKIFDRRRESIAVGNLVGATAEKIGNDGVAELHFPGSAKIRHSGERDCRAQQLLACAEPKCQMAARGMADRYNALEIEIELGRDRLEMIGCFRDIIER